MLIPPGFRLLTEGEVACCGDQCMYASGGDCESSSDIDDWEMVEGIEGEKIITRGTTELSDYWVIRKGEPPPVKDKEWLNPWE